MGTNHRTTLTLHKFLSLLPESHSDKQHKTTAAAVTSNTESAVVDSRSGSLTDLSAAVITAAKDEKPIRSDSTTSNVSTVSGNSIGFLKLGN